MTRGIFVTGTDTGAGKTLVSSAILAALVRRGVRAAACKPVETGCPEEGGELIGEDCRRLAAATGGAQRARDVAAYLFREPAAPLVAAEAEGTAIERTTLEAHYAAIRDASDFVLVESAGGLLVPLAGGWTTRDFAREIGLPALVVVASKLGCINHALLTFEVLRASGIAIAGYVVNAVDTDDRYALALRTNRDVLARFAGAPELAAFPFVEEARRDDAAFLAELAETSRLIDRLMAHAAPLGTS